MGAILARKTQGSKKASSSFKKTGAVAPLLLAWYDTFRRALPWRALPGQAADPYRVWLSEVMLQQTTVPVVGAYYARFLARWPTLESLAKADLDEVLKVWAGLGYYRRARLLHEAARQLVAQHGGVFPRDVKELQALPGMGPYTAAAVAAIAFDARACVVDGNVERVTARLFVLRDPLPGAKKKLRALAETLLPAARYGDFAQGMMDLGATVCTPQSPKCELCPLRALCVARRAGVAEALPARTAPKAKPVRRALAFYLVGPGGKVLVRQRPPSGLLGGMTELPSSAWREGAFPDLEAEAALLPFRAAWRLAPGHTRSVFTHFTLEAEVAIATTRRLGVNLPGARWEARATLGQQAWPSALWAMVELAEAASSNAPRKGRKTK